jgi:hypothetical protein
MLCNISFCFLAGILKSEYEPTMLYYRKIKNIYIVPDGTYFICVCIILPALCPVRDIILVKNLKKRKPECRMVRNRFSKKFLQRNISRHLLFCRVLQGNPCALYRATAMRLHPLEWRSFQAPFQMEPVYRVCLR